MKKGKKNKWIYLIDHLPQNFHFFFQLKDDLKIETLKRNGHSCLPFSESLSVESQTYRNLNAKLRKKSTKPTFLGIYD